MNDMTAVAMILKGALGPIVFVAEDLMALQDGAEGDRFEVRFNNEFGEPFGTVCVELHDDGEGLVVGLRGWQLNDDVASV